MELVTQHLLMDSVAFLRKLVAWVDDTYEALTAGGQNSTDSWYLVTHILKTLFEDYISAQRGLLSDVSVNDRDERMSYNVWGVFVTHRCIKDLLVDEIKNHSVVMGAYSQWLVLHSGRAELKCAMATVDSLEKAVKKIKEDIKSLETTASTAKKTADRAWNKVRGGTDGTG